MSLAGRVPSLDLNTTFLQPNRKVESETPESTIPYQTRHLTPPRVQGFLIVLRNSEFMRLTAAQMCSAFLSLGVSQVENQVLLVLFGFQQHEFALVFAIAGAGMFLAQVLPSTRYA